MFSCMLLYDKGRRPQSDRPHSVAIVAIAMTCHLLSTMVAARTGCLRLGSWVQVPYKSSRSRSRVLYYILTKLKMNSI